MKKIVFFSLLFVIFSCKNNTPKETASPLTEVFKYNKAAKPIISVHRGGKSIIGYPENCLETLKYVNNRIEAIYEIDVAKTKDNILVLMHDDNLERNNYRPREIK